MALEVNEERAVVVVAPQREVVDAHDGEGLPPWRQGKSTHEAEQGAATGEQPMTPGETGSGSTPQAEAEIFHERLQRRTATRVSGHDWGEVVGKGLVPTGRIATAEATELQL
jgi:hypothetical protein